MTAQGLFFDVFFKTDPHLNAVEYQNAIYIHVYVFFDIKKFADFQWKNVDVSRMNGVCHGIFSR